MPSVFRPFLIVLVGLVLAGSGCTKQARMERLMAAGNKAIAAGDYKLAEEKYRSALRLVPENPEVLSRVGIMAYQQGRPLSAYSLLAGVQRKFPNDVDVQLTYGLACLTLVRPSEARLAAKRVLEKEPANEEALLLLAETCMTTRDNEEALRLVEKSRAGGRDTSGHHVALGALLLARREPAAAEAELRKALEMNPKSAAAYTYLAGLARAQDKPEEATQALRQAAELSITRSPRRIKYIDFLMRAGKLAEARGEVAKILAPAPDYVPAWVLKMKIDFLEQKYEDSDAAAGEALSRDRANYEALMQRAAIKLVKGDIEGVINDLKRIEGFFDRAPQVKYQLALAYMKNGNRGRAEDYLVQALRLSPDYDDAILLSAELQIQKGEPAKAIGPLTRLLQARHQIPRAYILLAQAYRANGNLAKALEVFQVFGAGYDQIPEGPYLVGSILIEMGRKDEARKAFELSLSRNGNYWPAMEGLVNLDLTEKKGTAAADRANILLEKNPAVAAAWMLRAKVRIVAGESEGAESDLLKAIELEPRTQYPYLLLSRIYFQTNRAREALEKLKALAGQNPNLNVLMQLGMLHDALKQPDEARVSYEKVVELDPSFSPALNNLAILYAERLRQLDKALEFARRAQSARPNDPVVADTLGWMLFHHGQYERALRLAQQAAEKIPADPEIQYHLGLIQYFLGQVEPARQSLLRATAADGQPEIKAEAARRLAILAIDPANPDPAIRARLEEALRLDPNDPMVLGRLAQIEARAGQMSEAANHYEALLRINAGSVPAMLALIDLNFGALAKPARARELVALVRAAEPNDPQIAWQVGRQLLNVGDFVAATPLLLDASRAYQDRPDVHYELARSYYGLGRVAETEKSLATALASEGTFPARKEAAAMATLIAMTRQPVLKESDLQAARGAIAEDDGNVPALMVVALGQERRKDYRDAVQTYEKVLKIYPLFAQAMRQLAILYGEQLGDDQKAEQFAQKARQTFTEDAELDFQLGTINYRRADYPAAIRFLQQSLLRRADRAETLFFLGMAHYQSKNPTEARGELQKAVSLKLPPQEETEAKKILEQIDRGGVR